jgi:hypothetical protein
MTTPTVTAASALPVAAPDAALTVPVWRLYTLRAMYLLMSVGLGSVIWPGLIQHPLTWTQPLGVARSMLGALAPLALLGLRYPLQMLPLLFYEMTWKIVWLLFIAYPLWSAGRMDAAHLDTFQEVALIVIMPFAIPWRYVIAHYVMRRGDRWR